MHRYRLQCADIAVTMMMTISYTKCNLPYINSMTNPHNVDMLLGSDKIVTVDSAKDLGIIVDSELKFPKHIGNIVARTHAPANLIHICFLPRDVQTLTRALTVYVCPLLEVLVFGPHISRVGLIELNQRSVASQSGYVY